jgi:hypothetical protein
VEEVVVAEEVVVVVVVVVEEAVINLLHIRMRDAIIVVTAHGGAHAITWD